MADADGFFTHPFRRRSGRRQIADVIAQSAGFDHFGGRQQDAAVVHAGSQVQDRRNTHGLADLGQTRSAEHLGGFRCQQAFHGAGDAVAAGGQHDHVIFDQLFDHGDMGFVVPGAGIVAARPRRRYRGYGR